MYAIFNSNKWYWHVGPRQFKPDPYFIHSFAEVEMEIKMAKRQDFTADILFFDKDTSIEKAIKYVKDKIINQDSLKYLKEISIMMGI